jgi:hypothetical protein
VNEKTLAHWGLSRQKHTYVGNEALVLGNKMQFNFWIMVLDSCANGLIQVFEEYRFLFLSNVTLRKISVHAEGRGFDSRWCHWNVFIDIILPAALWRWG